eukprot:Rmarinus@m.22935
MKQKLLPLSEEDKPLLVSLVKLAQRKGRHEKRFKYPSWADYITSQKAKQRDPNAVDWKISAAFLSQMRTVNPGWQSYFDALHSARKNVTKWSSLVEYTLKSDRFFRSYEFSWTRPDMYIRPSKIHDPSKHHSIVSVDCEMLECALRTDLVDEAEIYPNGDMAKDKRESGSGDGKNENEKDVDTNGITTDKPVKASASESANGGRATSIKLRPKRKRQPTTRVLLRASIVGEDGKTLMDKFVRIPKEYKVVNYLDDIHGITKEMIDNETGGEWVDFEDAQREALSFISRETVVVGHSLSNDLLALGLLHLFVIDTASVFELGGVPGAAPGLGLLAQHLCKVGRLEGTAESIKEMHHDSVWDARVTLLAAEMAVGKTNLPFPISQGEARPANTHKLLLHRLPGDTDESEIELRIKRKMETNLRDGLVPTFAITRLNEKNNFASAQLVFNDTEGAERCFELLEGDLEVDGKLKPTKKIQWRSKTNLVKVRKFTTVLRIPPKPQGDDPKDSKDP